MASHTHRTNDIPLLQQKFLAAQHKSNTPLMFRMYFNAAFASHAVPLADDAGRQNAIRYDAVTALVKTRTSERNISNLRREIAMTVYAIAQLTITDRAAYNRYQSRFIKVMNRFKGRLLAADEHPLVLEGQWDHEKLVLMSFPDEAAFREWAESPAYEEIAKDRKAGSTAVVLLVRGLA